MPNFDRLPSDFLYANRVRTPARDTQASIPSLLLGKTIPADEEMRLTGSDALVRFDGCSDFVDLTSQPNVFSRARNAGFNTAITGWHHPYCRLFGKELSECTWQAAGSDSVDVSIFLRRKPLYRQAWYLAEWTAESLAFVVEPLHWMPSIPEQAHVIREEDLERTRSTVDNAERMLRDSSLNFVFLHMTVPHPPGIWDTHKQAFTMNKDSNYISNLELADRILGRIERVLKENGDWDRSTILISSDHPFRPSLWLYMPIRTAEMIEQTRMQWQPYVPFFLKLPGQKTGLAYHREFNSVLSADLLLEALQGKVHTSAQAVQWLDAHAAVSEGKVCR